MWLFLFNMNQDLSKEVYYDSHTDFIMNRWSESYEKKFIMNR
jgi:enamine deaminase RidA (YjgF/YER057c/UK114 family)